jgi:hypothetical protein
MSRSLTRLRISVISIAAAALAASCATLVKAPLDLAPERLLPSGAAAYARLDGATLAATLSALPGGQAASVADIAKRTDSMTVAFMAASSGRKAGLVAVAKGRYPAGAASLKLSTDPSWKKDGAVWRRKDGSMNLAFADGGRAFFGTGAIDGMVAASASPNPYPIPARWDEAWSAAVAVYLPDPMSLFRSRIPMGDGEVPMVAMVMAAEAGRGATYATTLYFEFATERAAVVFSPLCRIFFYAAAHALWPERAATVVDETIWRTDGAVVQASGITLDAASLSSFARSAGFSF